MKDIFAIRKKKSFVCFLVFLTLEIILNIVSLGMLNGYISPEKTLSLFEIVYVFLPIIEIVCLLFVISYFLTLVERLATLIKHPYGNCILRFIQILTVFFVVAIFVVFFAEIRKLSLPNINIIDNQIVVKLIIPRLVKGTELYFTAVKLWYEVYVLGLFAVACILCKDFSKKNKLCKKLKGDKRFILAIKEKKQALSKFKTATGLEYKDSDFYKQTNINYSDLNHENGTAGEFELYKQLVSSDIKGMTYIFNREIPKSDGLFTEIDLIVIHKKGIFVIENKDYETDVFGKATEHDLTIIKHSGEKVAIYNPIRQNERHVEVLKEYLYQQRLYSTGYHMPIYSIVVFTDTRSDKSDDIIANIDMKNSNSKLCTSQNISFVIDNTIKSTSFDVNIDTVSISNKLLSLKVRKK